MEITVIGLGYVGLPVACSFAKAGIKVYGIDNNKKLIDSLLNRTFHYTEKDLDTTLDKVINKSLFVSENIIESNTYIVTVQTPLNKDKSGDVSYIEKVYYELANHIKNNDLIILESTVPVGANEYLFNFLRNLVDTKIKFDYCYCPESILPGNIFYEIQNNNRILGGNSIEASKRAETLYNKINQGKKELTNIKTAEFVKLVQNAHRDVELAFVNQLSIMCDKEDVDVFKVIDIAQNHPRCHLLQPGSGVGGHCIAIDPYFLIDRFEKNASLISIAREVNNKKPIYIANKAIDAIKHDKSKVIGILGLSYKANCEDCRGSSGIVIYNYLKDKGYQVYANEINSKEKIIQGIKNYDILYVIKKCDVIIIAQKHDKYIDINLQNKIVINPVNLQYN